MSLETFQALKPKPKLQLGAGWGCLFALGYSGIVFAIIYLIVQFANSLMSGCT